MAQPLSISGTFTNNVGTLIEALQLMVNNPVNQRLSTALSSGFNSFSIPGGTTFILISLPVGNSISVTLKGVTGDTGLPLAVTGAALWTPLSSATVFGLTAGSAIAALTTIDFI